MRVLQTSADFDALMAEVDAFLQETGAPLPARELRVASEVARRLERGFPMTGPFDFTPVDGLYSGPSLMGHINRWLAGRYGDRLKVDLSLGYSAFSLRSDAWLLRIPLIFGGFRAVAERDLSITYPSVVVYRPGTIEKLTVGVLPLVRDLPQGLANTLTDAELEGIMAVFLQSYSAFRFLDRHRRSQGLALAAAQDLANSGRKAAGTVDEYGMARWDALQATEKALKLLLVLNGRPFPTRRDGHDLTKLLTLCVPVGLSHEAATFIASIQCDPGVRYETRPHRRDEVVLAHRSAVSVVCAAASAAAGIQPKSGEP